MQCQFPRLGTIDDAAGNLRRKERQGQGPCNATLVGVIGRGEFAHGDVAAVEQVAPPAVGLRESFEEGRIRFGLWQAFAVDDEPDLRRAGGR